RRILENRAIIWCIFHTKWKSAFYRRFRKGSKQETGNLSTIWARIGVGMIREGRVVGPYPLEGESAIPDGAPPRRLRHRKSSRRFPDQPHPEIVCLLAVFRELLVPVSLLLCRVKERGDILRIIIELERVGDKHRLARPEDPGHRHFGRLRIPVKAHLLYHLLLCPGRVNETGPDLPAKER